MDAIFWKHYNLYTLLSCDHHLLFIDVKVLVHELQGLCAADEGQRVQAEDGPVLIHSSHVLGIFSLDPQGCHAADTQEEGELTTGSGHDQEFALQGPEVGCRVWQRAPADRPLTL